MCPKKLRRNGCAVDYMGKSCYCRNVSDVLCWTRKVFGVFNPACLSCDSGHRNYPISLKFDTNAYVLCKISYIVFGVRYPNSSIQGHPNYLNTYREKFLLVHLVHLDSIKYT